MSFNFFTIMVIIQTWRSSFFYDINLDRFSPAMNYFLTLFILYFLPVFSFNYYMIFYKNKFKNIIHLFAEVKERYLYRYVQFSILGPVILFWISYVLNKLY